MQRRSRPDASTFIGSGKVDELRDVVLETGADTVICDGELSAAQLRNLEDKVKVKVVDRTALILDIFAQHAKSREGKTQVELAQLDYLSQRLRGWGENLSRQAGGRAGGATGGVGTRGPGETKLETDRRRIRTRMAKLRRELADHARRRATPSGPSVGVARCRPSRSPVTPTPASRRCSTGSPGPASWSRTRCSPPSTRPSGGPRPPTVASTRWPTRSASSGSLPHQLVEAFRSTLEEVVDADLILHVVDGSHADPEGQLRAVREVLAEIGARRGAGGRGRQQDRRRRPAGGLPAAARRARRSRGVGAHR